MPKRIIKRFTPDHGTIRNHKYLSIFGTLLHDPNLWHMNRRSVAGAFAVGLFWAFIPIPFQMVAAAATAIPARVNLTISVALVWITNPITMPPMFYGTYLVGAWATGEPLKNGDFEMTMEWFANSMSQIWLPLYLGSLICGLIAAAVGYFTIRGLWRLQITKQWNLRKLRKRRNNNK